MNQHAKYLGQTSFSSKIIAWTYRHTHPTNRSTWTTKVVCKNNEEPASTGSSLRPRRPCFELLCTNMLSDTASSGPSQSGLVDIATCSATAPLLYQCRHQCHHFVHLLLLRRSRKFIWPVCSTISTVRTRNVGQCPTWWPPCRIQVAPSVQRRKVWLTPTTRVPCSNAAKTRNPMKLAGMPPNSRTDLSRSSPYYEAMWRRYCCLKSFFSDCRDVP